MNKLAQQYQDSSSELLSKLLGPITTAAGIAGAYYGGKHVWQGSPEIRMAAMLGIPAALYKYMSYRDPMNMLKAQTDETKKFYDQLQKDPNSAYHNPELLNQVHQMKTQRILDDYGSPVRTSLRKALPMFAMGAALPTALRIIKG